MEKVEEGHDEYAAKAHGLLLKIESFDMYFGLKLACLIFSAGKQLSINLKAKNTTVQEAHVVLICCMHILSYFGSSNMCCL